MLRGAVLTLAAINLVWWGWSHGVLGPSADRWQAQAEPERLERQVRPQALSIRHGEQAPPEEDERAAAGPQADSPGDGPAPVTPDAPAEPAPEPAREALPEPESPDSPDPDPDPERESAAAPRACMQAGVFDEPQAGQLRSALAAVDPDRWRLDSSELAARWMVYLGPLEDAVAVQILRGELRQRGIDVDQPGAGREPGLSLGRYSTETGARRALRELAGRGVEGAQVVQERPRTREYVLVLPDADPALSEQVRQASDLLASHPLQPCD